MLQRTKIPTAYCNTLQHTATHCNTPKHPRHTATHCNRESLPVSHTRLHIIHMFLIRTYVSHSHVCFSCARMFLICTYVSHSHICFSFAHVFLIRTYVSHSHCVSHSHVCFSLHMCFSFAHVLAHDKYVTCVPHSHMCPDSQERTCEGVTHMCRVVCCSVLQCVAVCCSVLQCVAVCCSICDVSDSQERMCEEGTHVSPIHTPASHTCLHLTYMSNMALIHTRALIHKSARAKEGHISFTHLPRTRACTLYICAICPLFAHVP